MVTRRINGGAAAGLVHYATYAPRAAPTLGIVHLAMFSVCALFYDRIARTHSLRGAQFYEGAAYLVFSLAAACAMAVAMTARQHPIGPRQL
jgi:hypothetical protein